MLLVLLAVLGCQLVAWVGPFWVVVVFYLLVLPVLARGFRPVRCPKVWPVSCLGWLVRVLFQGRAVRW